VDADSGYIELAHDPIASLKWPRMSMGFQVEDKQALHALKEGDRVQFQLYPKPDKEGNFLIKKIERRS
jgi:Cu(I)/Ag(I) efflux system membrane fusion protein